MYVMMISVCPALPDVSTHKATVTAGETFVYSFNYSSFNVSSGRSGAQQKKFLCKGDDPTTCSQMWNGEPEVSDNQQLSNVTVTLQAVTLGHNGTYWCGARAEGRSSNLIFYRLQLQVGKRGVSRSTAACSLSKFYRDLRAEPIQYWSLGFDTGWSYT